MTPAIREGAAPAPQAGRALPAIELAIDAGHWPPFDRLATIAADAIAAAISVADLAVSPHAELSLLFTDDRRIRDLNKQWRGFDKPTNVLSFPAARGTGEPGPLLGDIALAFETVEREARLEELTMEHHVCHLLIHGFFHLFGYDHQTDQEAAVMEALERQALAKLAIADPYGDRPQ